MPEHKPETTREFLEVARKRQNIGTDEWVDYGCLTQEEKDRLIDLAEAGLKVVETRLPTVEKLTITFSQKDSNNVVKYLQSIDAMVEVYDEPA